MTVDETWIHHYTPESKQQSKQWTASGASAPKTVLLAGKVMVAVFLDSQEIILVDYLEKRNRRNAKLHELGFELISHPPNSPDLVPCNFFLFPT